MENETRSDSQTPHSKHDNLLAKSDGPTSNSPKQGSEEEEEETAQNSQPNDIASVNPGESETDSGSAWNSKQGVEEVSVSSLPDVNGPSDQESTVRRRKGKSENDTSELRKLTSKVTHDTFTESYDTHTPELDPDSPEAVKKREKIKKIREVLSSEPLDLKTLKELAISSGGLLDDGLRKEAWPLLMGMGLEDPEIKKPTLELVQGHRDYQQVVLDVKRTLKRFPPGIEDSRRLVLMDQLTVLIIRGYHDVAITFLLVTGEDMGFRLVEKLSVTHLRDFMRPTMEKTNYYLTYLYPILENANQPLYECLEKSGVGTVFCLPWLITWFAHTLSDYRHVVRLYDFFLASPDLMPMYIATAIVLQKEKELMADNEGEVSSVFAILSKDPDNLPFEDILVKARELYEKYPPDPLTERVEKILARREEEEKKERQRIDEMRKKGDLYRKKKNRGVMDKIFTYFPIPMIVPARSGKLIKFALFTFSIILARSLYKQYYTSAIEYPSVPE
ncbi:TBC1 domain family member 20 [Portunus trituberculatus]|uniref:TBC1 domain family member 20 n=1 Tax=Portunus trituberculatus TaxID=210409 RepID=A0A5B7F2B7_PORTR|nr:TBC1 domain family member 20 [Portunus trituberculatus]